MPRLYEMTAELADLYESITVGDDGSIDEETMTAIDACTAPWRDKVIAIAALVKNLESDAKAFDEHESIIKARRQRIEREVERLKTYVRENMDALGEQEIEGGLLKVRLCRNSQPTVAAPMLENVPLAFIVRPDPQLDKKKCLDHYKRGVPVPGVEFLVGKHLRIQ